MHDDSSVENAPLHPPGSLAPTNRHIQELPAMLAALPRLSEEEAERYGEDIASARSELAGLPVREARES